MPARSLLLPFLFVLSFASSAQPDTLYVPEHDTIVPYAVVYPPLQQAESFQHVGRFALDTSRIAVKLGFKRGKPCGVYRAFYPDGRPLIFAVYGWGYLHGDWTEYGPDGHVSLKGKYDQGKRDGTWGFRDQGIVGHYKDGLKHGKWKYYQEGRLVRVERYHKDKQLQGGTFFFK
jgi:hypothetical protein